jgi:hypothetical protein
MVEGYTCEIEKPRGLKAKAQCTEGLTGMLPVDPMARNDLDRRIRIRRLRLAAALQRRHRRRRTAASGGGIAGETRSRVFGHQKTWQLALDVQTDLANSKKGSTSTDRRRRRCTSQRGDQRRKASSGELLRAAHDTGASISNTCGFLTSTRSSCTTPQ